MGREADTLPSQIQAVFLPFPTPGHMIPMVDFAKIMSTFPGVHCTIVTTPANAALFRTSITAAAYHITTEVLDFPAEAVGLPARVENFSALTSSEMRGKLFKALSMLQNPTQDLIRQISPHCIISDMFYPWTSDFANEIGVPRFVFHGGSTFYLSCLHALKTHTPHQSVDSDTGVVCLPSLPHKISMLKSQVPEWLKTPTAYTLMMDAIEQAELKSQGIVANTLQEMEAAYVDHYSSVTGLKVWAVGPISLWVGYEDNDMVTAQRGRENGPGADSSASCLEWLDRQKPNSVLYVSFGSLTKFPADQLKEIAAGLEESGHNFLWVARKNNNNNGGVDDDDDDVEWLPEGFRERMREKDQGFIIQGWAPQILILGHKSVGGMVTHCGWNSIFEGVSAGLPMVTWPLFAEQFYNERLVVDVLGTGVAVGVTMWCNIDEVGQKEVVRREKVAAAAMAVMGEGEHAAERRRRAAELGVAAKEAVKKDGSSQANAAAFIEEIRAKRGVSEIVFF